MEDISRPTFASGRNSHHGWFNESCAGTLGKKKGQGEDPGLSFFAGQREEVLTATRQTEGGGAIRRNSLFRITSGDLDVFHGLLEGALDGLGDVLGRLRTNRLQLFGLLNSSLEALAEECGLELDYIGE